VAGIVGDCLVGPHVLPHRFTGNHYRDFLSHDLPKLLEAVPLENIPKVCNACVTLFQGMLFKLL
jgi:hypothetical protein